MKRLILFLLFLIAIRATAQRNTFLGIYGGGGLATAYNYDVGLSGGAEYLKGMSYRSCFGATIFYQQYSLRYDIEANSQTHMHGYAGFIDRHKSAYIFIAPKYTCGIGPKQRVHFYLNVGVGFNMGGYDSVWKWDHTFDQHFINGNYDSVIDASANIKKTVLRFGMGLKEYMRLGRNWWFTVTEDFGFLPQSLSATTDVDHGWPAKTPYFPEKMNPLYISLQIGISRTSN